MAQRGELNLGQLMRERHGRDTVNVGFTTYAGTVTAATDWGGPAERMKVRRALPNRYEARSAGVGLGDRPRRSASRRKFAPSMRSTAWHSWSPEHNYAERLLGYARWQRDPAAGETVATATAGVV